MMDLEQRHVIDLLPVRSATSFADWLRQHSGVQIIARDHVAYTRRAAGERALLPLRWSPTGIT
jgi:hypothetical protein